MLDTISISFSAPPFASRYNAANRQVAILCNHQRTVSKAQESMFENLNEKLSMLKEQRGELAKYVETTVHHIPYILHHVPYTTHHKGYFIYRVQYTFIILNHVPYNHRWKELLDKKKGDKVPLKEDDSEIISKLQDDLLKAAER
ncbi:hypothetical protein EON65_03515 [archaeon]|nr:MAG: hypothetical protein EON65_03515 [archaeon]